MNQHKPLAIILHLFYTDLWNYFLPYLNNIEVEYDLYVSVSESEYGHPTQVYEIILQSHPDAKIYSLLNRGMDVAPFLFILNEIHQSGARYDCLLKLHSKKSLAHSIELGERWRNDLTKSLLESPERFNMVFSTCKNHPKYKMAGSSNWVLPQTIGGYEQQFFNAPILFSDYYFVGGTMFLVNFDVLMSWFISQDIFNRFYHQFEDGYIGDGSIAHQLERVFGCLMRVDGFEILKT